MYVIEELTLDPSENTINGALNYDVVKVVYREWKAKRFIKNCKIYTHKDCWAISKDKPLPRFRYKEETEL